MTLYLTGDLTSFEALCAAADDGRGFPEQDQLRHTGLAVMNEILDVISDTAFVDHLPTIAEAILGGFQSMMLRLEREHDRATDKVRQLNRDFDGSEILDVELQDALREARALEAVTEAVEIMRNAASETYTVNTGNIWSPWKGSVRRTATTIAQIDSKDALRAKNARKHSATDPGDQVVAIRGAYWTQGVTDANRVLDALNWAKSQYPRMKLVTSGATGVETHARKWAMRNGIDVVDVKFDKKSHGNAAAFRVNDEMLALDPVLVLTLPNSLDTSHRTEKGFGPVLNIGQKAEAAGIRHIKITHAG